MCPDLEDVHHVTFSSFRLWTHIRFTVGHIKQLVGVGTIWFDLNIWICVNKYWLLLPQVFQISLIKKKSKNCLEMFQLFTENILICWHNSSGNVLMSLSTISSCVDKVTATSRDHEMTDVMNWTWWNCQHVIPLYNVDPSNKVKSVPEEPVWLPRRSAGGSGAVERTSPSLGLRRFVSQLLLCLALQWGRMCNCLRVYTTVKVECEGRVFSFSCVWRGITFIFHQFILVEEKHFVFCANKHEEAGYVSALVDVNYSDGKSNEKRPSSLQRWSWSLSTSKRNHTKLIRRLSPQKMDHSSIY